MEIFSGAFRRCMEAQGLVIKEVAALSGVSQRTIEKWIGKANATPAADSAYAVARALHTTVEYLVDGEKGSEYVRDLVRKEGSVFRPPDRIADVVDDLIESDEATLAAVRSVIRALHPTQRERKDTG